jgi:predicted MFS family arabinose efflux permease
MHRSLFQLLSAANFVIGFGAFVVIGLIEPIAAAHAVSPSEAGRAMTVYALAYALGSPIGVAVMGRYSRNTVLSVGMGLFMVGSLASALAPGFGFLLAARAVAAFGAGLFTPSASAVAVALSEPANRARAISSVFAGLTIAQVVGVPAGTWLGYRFGPEFTFGVVAALAGVAAVAVWRVVPAVAVPPTSLAALGRVLRTPHLVVAVSFTATFLAAIYVVYTYLGPLLTHLYGLGPEAKTALFFVYGAAAVAGNWVGGRLTEGFGAVRTLMLLAVLQVGFLLAVPNVALAVPFTALLLFGWALSGWSFLTPQQSRLVQLAPEQTQALFSLNASCIYAAAAIGTAIGGLTLRTGGFEMLGGVAAGMALLAIGHLALSSRLAARAGGSG